MKNYLFLLLSLFLLFPQSAWSWGQKGHRIITEIAYRHLDKGARRHVDAVLGERGMVYWANWADEIKSDTIFPQSSNWHFQDLDAGLSDSLLVDMLVHYPLVGGRLFCVTDSLTERLRHNPDEVTTLRFLVHLEGDRFCPMHTAHLDDKGGNTVKVKWFAQQQTNLHALWDTGIIDARGYSYTEYADYLERLYRGREKEIRAMTRADVLRCCYSLCNEIYAYQELWNGNPYHYVYHFAPQLEYQLYMAGIRLADLLNALYK